ncbi:MAG TPA: type II toxin-antitoxin system HicB family antitoxin [Bryobacteraceae bacterium]|jgi:predicted RNase H-like HicB family nuclease|nr:type II toxin-antitoxin system HicB family antitoxin [Bryobacteraceae bacterium]
MAFSLTSVLSQPSLHILIWEEDGAYIAKCLEIPGCVSQGNTREEALANIRDAISQCIEVIKEDANKPQDPSNSVELIERPLSDFIEAR